MSECEVLHRCQFFNGDLLTEPEEESLIKERYCLFRPEECARFQVFKAVGPDHVPRELFPNMIHRAKGIIEDNS